jgi:hypothetical protein
MDKGGPMIWQALWRLAASGAVIVAAWVLLGLIAREVVGLNPGYSPDTGTIWSFFLAGVVVMVSVWSLIRLWNQFLRRTAGTPDGPWSSAAPEVQSYDTRSNGVQRARGPRR